MDALQVLFYSSLSLGLACFVFGCVLLRKDWPPIYRFLLFLAGFRAFLAIGSFVYSTLTHLSNHWIYNIWQPLECLGFLYVFYKEAIHRDIRRLNGWMMLSVLPVVPLTYLIRREFFRINNYAILFCCFLILVASCAAYVDMLLNTKRIRLYRQPLFWYTGGMLMYTIDYILFTAAWDMSIKMLFFKYFIFANILGEVFLYAGLLGVFICLYRMGSGNLGETKHGK